jgi:hypothetical protein
VAPASASKEVRQLMRLHRSELLGRRHCGDEISSVGPE